MYYIVDCWYLYYWQDITNAEITFLEKYDIFQDINLSETRKKNVRKTRFFFDRFT